MLQMQRSTQSQQKLMKRIPWVWNTGQCSRRISPPVKVRHVSSVNPSVVTGYSQSVKPFSAIPGPPRLPVLGTLLPYKLGIKDLPNYHHDVCQLYQKYGPVVREVFGSQTVVHVFNPADIQTIYESDGKTPHIPPLQETTRFYRQQKDMSLGLGNLNGNEWYKLRRAVQQMMLRPKEVSYYYPLQDSVAERVVEKLVGLVDDKGNVPELDFIVGKWILESAGMCCFEKSLGCLEGGEEEDLAQKLVEANMQIFKLSADLKFSLRLYRYLTTPKYKKLHNLEDFFYGVSLSFIREAMALIQSLMEEGKLSEGQFNFLTYLMSRQELSEKDVLTITLSLFSDGLSTTSPTLLGNLHCLALNPEVQERLYQDILMKVDPSTPITLDHINTLHYLKAFVKEVFRFYPIGESVQRLPQRDLVLSGYHVPAGTYVDLNAYVWLCDKQYFKEPEKFLPERWLRGGKENTQVHPYILNPFSIGTRMCAGRRFAEQDLYVGLCRLLLKFRLVASDPAPPSQEWRMLLRPKSNLPIRFIPRD